MNSIKLFQLISGNNNKIAGINRKTETTSQKAYPPLR